MINLLPQKEKQELLFQKNRNLVIVLGSTAIIFLICLALVLLSIKFYILQIISNEKAILKDAEEKYQTPNSLLFLDSLKKNNADLSIMDSFYKKKAYLSDDLKTILQTQRPDGITFNSISLGQTGSDNRVKISILGTSATRDELLSFKDNITSQASVKNIYLPPENLVKPTNISFNLNFEIHPVK
ncbi:MAG: hypothetical protein AAB340_03675 [Patescibacteria group bacterium]